MYDTMIQVLQKYIQGSLRRRGSMIEERVNTMGKMLSQEQPEQVYEELAETSRHVELMVKELREALICFHGDLQTVGFLPENQPYPFHTDTKIKVDGNCIHIIMGAMLPYPTNGSVYYLHEQVDKALNQFIAENNMPRPFYTERCAVVFLHHYGNSRAKLRHLRDYDNVEHRCITNVIASHLLWGDSPKCIIGMDVLAPDDTNFTEIRIMPIQEFRDFVMSEKIEYVP